MNLEKPGLPNLAPPTASIDCITYIGYWPFAHIEFHGTHTYMVDIPVPEIDSLFCNVEHVEQHDLIKRGQVDLTALLEQETTRTDRAEATTLSFHKQ